ncbi:U3 small nucleolar RNA-associated protein 6 homolog [Ctenocephalides felis]|uniref:U3 small nucleolar RNA-associated protein 6 homolog n=1 Tax=Ctenocephalides felis TaxID=7515 RepID=UPI000E6E300C|nr:U3 small nucleolar RNA-associated protein 6 homolog [Ctenocephalides felis]
MSEFVDSRMELMIPEMKLMLRNKLATKDEIMVLIKRRKHFEHKLAKHTKSKTDFINFIMFETNLFQDIKKRRDIYNIRKDVDKIDLSVARHIDSLYKIALSNYSADISLWMSYIEYCKSVGFKDSISKAFVRLLRIHMDKTQLWAMAAKWEVEDNNNVANALAYLARGIGHHPNDACLHSEVFNLTLLQSGKKNEVPDIKQAEVIYNTAVKNIKDVDFLIGLMKIADKYPFARPLRDRIVSDLKEMYPKEEKVWHYIAKLTLMNKNTIKCSNERFELCLSIYKEAVAAIPTKNMWRWYIETLVELNSDCECFIVDERIALEEAMEEAHSLGMMEAEHYMEWLKLLNTKSGKEEEILKIMSDLSNKNMLSVDLWLVLLQYHLSRGEHNIGQQVFEKAINALGEDAYLIWKANIMYFISLPDDDAGEKVQEMFLAALQQPPKISQPMKPRYLEWLAMSKNITWARNAYKALVQFPPFCLDLHRKMAQLESSQVDPDMDNWRKCHEDATRLFGKCNKDVWIDFIKFEMTDGGQPEKVNILYNEAKHNLKQDLVHMFELDFTQLTSSLAENEVEG